jgi:hypothetical protein
MVDSLEAERMVLENWKKERAELDSLILVMEKKIAARTGLSPTSTASGGRIGADEFFRLSTTEAIKKFLKIMGKPARATQEIIDGLKRGGASVANYTNVYTSLGRLQKRTEVVKVGDAWGLEEWYPPAPMKLKAVGGLGNSQDTEELNDVEPPEEFPEAKTEEEEVEVEANPGNESVPGTGKVKGKSRKDEIADFIKLHGPSTRAEIMAATGIGASTYAFCMKDNQRFIKGEDGKWQNVE